MWHVDTNAHVSSAVISEEKGGEIIDDIDHMKTDGTFEKI